MYKPNKSFKILKHQEDKTKLKQINILCWNVAKLSKKEDFLEYLKKIIKEENINFLALQEFKKSFAQKTDFFDFSYILAPNIETKKNVFGVLSAFKIPCQDFIALLSNQQELKFSTHKSALICIFKLNQNTKLMFVNIHAINFVPNKIFIQELNNIKKYIKNHKGPLIIAGDFNTWNKQRIQALENFKEELVLTKVTYSDNSSIKKIFSNHLDYIFFKKIKFCYSRALKSEFYSDHNPIIAHFEPLS